MECDTLVGRLAGLLLDRACPDVPDLHEVRRRDYVYLCRACDDIQQQAHHASLSFYRRWRRQELAFFSVMNSNSLASTLSPFLQWLRKARDIHCRACVHAKSSVCCEQGTRGYALRTVLIPGRASTCLEACEHSRENHQPYVASALFLNRISRFAVCLSTSNRTFTPTQHKRRSSLALPLSAWAFCLPD